VTKIRSAGRRKHGRAGALVRMSPTPGRGPCDDVLVHGRRFHGLGQSSFNGRDGVHLDVARRRPDHHRFGQLHHRAFGRAVGGSKCGAEDGIQASDVADSSSALFDHRGRGKLRKRKKALKWVSITQSRVRGSPLDNTLEGADPGVVDQNAHRP